MAPEKLYRSWLVYDRNELMVPSLNESEDAWFSVDTFNENGVTKGTPVRAATTAGIRSVS